HVAMMVGDTADYQTMSDASVELLAPLAELIREIAEALRARDIRDALEADSWPAPAEGALGLPVADCVRLARGCAALYQVANQTSSSRQEKPRVTTTCAPVRP